MSAGESLAIGDRGLASFLIAFGITQLVEVPIYARALRDARLPFARNTFVSRAIVAFGASLLTHPIVWFAMPSVTLALYRASLRAGAPPLDELGRTLLYGALAETLAVIVEALYLRLFRVRHALVWSLVANAASVLVGTLLVLFL